MHPFPSDEELRVFIGDAIAQVSMDPYAVQFAFESMRRIVAEHRIEHLEPNGTIWGYDCEASDGPPLLLHRLLYVRIVAVEREDFRLTLRFEDSAALVVISELGSYECGHIADPELGVVVF